MAKNESDKFNFFDEKRAPTDFGLKTDAPKSSASAEKPFLSLAEEVQNRNLAHHKTTPDPLAVPLQLSSSEFTTAMVHFYRGEVQRSNVWRGRLDATTNWAVITTGATLSFVFSSPQNPHFAIPINTILVAIFLFMEARRYRYYEVWASRVRFMETGFFAPMLSSRSTTQQDKHWADHLAADLMSPHFTISEIEALGRRLRSNYIWIFLLLALSWNLKIYLHPFPAETLPELVKRAQVGLAPGWFVISFGVIFNMVLFFIAIVTLRLKDAASEVLPHEHFEWHPLHDVAEMTGVNNIRRRVAAVNVSKKEEKEEKGRRERRQRLRQNLNKKTDRSIHVTESPDSTNY